MIRFIKKLRLRDKLLLSYIPIVLVLVILFSVFIKQTVSRYIQNQLVYSAEMSCERTVEYLEQKIMSLSGILHMVVTDSVVEEAMNSKFNDMSYYHQYNLACRLEQSFISVVDKNEVDSIRIFMPDEFEFTNMDYTGKFSNIQKSEWYDRIVNDKKALLCVNEGELDGVKQISVGKVISEKNNFSSHVGALKLYISEDKIQDVLIKNLVSSEGISYIVNEYGEIISCSNYDRLDNYLITEEEFKKALESKDWTDIKTQNDKAVCNVSEIDYSGWYLVNVMSNEFLNKETRRLNRVMVINMLAAMLVSYILAYIISRSVNNRIIRLNSSITRANNGEFKPIKIKGDITDTKDEIDVLSENYNEMIEKLEKALEMQYENGKIIKNAELKILYEQINPHFLYNVLDLINWMAINNETQNISEVVTMLASYYKLSLNKGNEIISLEDELEHVRLYFEIQKIRFDNMEQIKFDVPNELMQCRILKTVFQPLLENFIKHGNIDDETPGVFSIKAYADEKDITFTVSDNGAGISEEILTAVKDGTYVSEEGSGFGLRSLNERIKMFYGDDYGISFGDCSKGAVIYMKIPKVSK